MPRNTRLMSIGLFFAIIVLMILTFLHLAKMSLFLMTIIIGMIAFAGFVINAMPFIVKKEEEQEEKEPYY